MVALKALMRPRRAGHLPLAPPLPGGGGLFGHLPSLREDPVRLFMRSFRTLALLSLHPDVQRRLERELDEVLDGRSPKLEDLPSLEFTQQVLKESMRLYPPVWMMARRVEDDDELGGHLLPKGSFVFISPYVTHRHPAFWENPEGFDPERFAPSRVAEEKKRGRPRYAYFPFSGGPRQCIGNHMAELEAQLLLATLLSRYRVKLSPGYRMELEPGVTLRPKHGLPMTLELRRPQR